MRPFTNSASTRFARMTIAVTALLLSALASSLVACGDDDAPAEKHAKKSRSAPEEPKLSPTRSRNTPPRIEQVRFEPESPGAGDTVRAQVDTTDAEEDEVWLRYSWKLGGRVLETESAQIALTGTTKGDLIEVTIVASDGKSKSRSWYSSTAVGNAAPILSRVEIEPSKGVVAGSQIVVRPEASDPDGDPIEFRYDWKVNGEPIDHADPVFSTETLRRGDTVQVAVAVSDGDDEGASLASPEIRITNSPPRIVSTPGAPTADRGFHYQVKAEDPDGGRNLQYRLEESPTGMTIDPILGVVRWRPSPGQAGKHVVSIVVDDLEGGQQRQRFELDVSDPAGSMPPASNRR